MASIDNLDIVISANASRAVQSLNALKIALRDVKGGIDAIGRVSNSTQSIKQFNGALKELSSIRSTTIDRISKNLSTLTNNNVRIEGMATSLYNLSSAVAGFSNTAEAGNNLRVLSSALSTFGYKNITQATANMPELTNQLRQMLDVIARAKKVNSNTIKSLNAIANVMNSLRVGSGGNNGGGSSSGGLFKQFSSGLLEKIGNGFSVLGNKIWGMITPLKKSTLSVQNLAYTFGVLYASMFWVKRLFDLISSAMTKFSDYIESFNFWDVAITSSVNQDTTSKWKEAGYKSAQAYAEGLEQNLADLNQKMTGFVVDVADGTGDISVAMQQNLGLSITELTQFQAKIESITTSMGLSSSTANEMAMSLSMLAGDISSLYNVDFSEASNNLYSGLIGQSRAMYKYGVDITATTLKQYAYENGITKSVSAMTQMEKMQLRMLAILDQSEVSWGDLANTIDNYANQIRVLKNGIKNLGLTIGRILVPIVSTILPYLNAMVKLLQKLFLWIAQLTGADFSGDSAIQGVDDDFSDLDDSISDATDSAKELKKTLLGFDEINAMSDATSGSSNSNASGGSSIDLSSQISEATKKYQSAWEEAYANVQDKATGLANTIEDFFKKKDFKGLGTYVGDGIQKGLGKIDWSKVYSVANGFGSGLAEFLNGLCTPETFSSVAKSIAGALNTVLQFQNGFLTEYDFSNLGDSIASGINTFFETYDFATAGDNFNKLVNGVCTAIGKALSEIKWEDIQKAWESFSGELSGTANVVLYLSLAYKILDTLGVGGLGASGLVLSAIKKVGLKSSILKGVATALGGTVSTGAIATVAGVTAGDILLLIGIGIAFAIGVNALKNSDVGKAIQDWSDKQSQVTEEKKASWSAWAENVRSSNKKAEKSIKSFLNADLPTQLGILKDSLGKTSKGLADVSKYAGIGSGAWKDYGTNVKDTSSGVSTDSDVMKASVITAFKNLKNNPTFSQFVENVKSKFSGLKTSVGNTANGINTNVTSNFGTMKTNSVSKVSALDSESQSKFKTMKTNLGEKAGNVRDAIVKMFESAKTNSVSKVSGINTSSQSEFRNMKKPISDKVSDVKDAIVSKFDDAKTKSASKLGEIKTKASSLFTKANWTFSGISEGLSQSISNGVYNMKYAWNSLVSGLTFSFNEKTAIGRIVKAMFGTTSFDFGSKLKFNLSAYANGGFPEDGLFMANHGELVGGFSNGKTAVANNGQIIEGIKQGVTEAMMEVAMATSNGNSGGTVEIPIYLDGREVARGTASNMEQLIRSGALKPSWV